jgi:hypothetical protein
MFPDICSELASGVSGLSYGEQFGRPRYQLPSEAGAYQQNERRKQEAELLAL